MFYVVVKKLWSYRTHCSETPPQFGDSVRRNFGTLTVPHVGVLVDFLFSILWPANNQTSVLSSLGPSNPSSKLLNNVAP